jgi:glycosyltransferase involved in cell wall biosynthesis
MTTNSSEKLNIVKPLVSIGLPVYNAELFMRKKIESLLEQTFSDFELIISDNGSTDSTSLICEEYAKKDKRIKYIKQEKNMGATVNYNIVLNHAQCKYFMWTAADDEIDSTFIEKVISILENNDTVVGCTSRMEMFGDFTEYLKPKKSDSQLRKFMKKMQRWF